MRRAADLTRSRPRRSSPGWAVGWPYAATALLAIGAFFTAESALNVGLSTAAAGGARAGQWAVGIGLMVVSALIYQPSALFYVVPVGRRR